MSNRSFSYPFDTKTLIDICTKNDVAMLGVFGSVARGENRPGSDIDLVVRFSKRKGLLALIRLERELSEALGMRVDLLTEASISPYIKDNIIENLKIIYEER